MFLYQTIQKTYGREPAVKHEKLEVVPVLLHKKEFDKIIGPEMKTLKENYQGKLSDAEFKKLVVDSFERFYYDCTGGNPGKQSRATKEARKTIRKQYGKIQDSLKPEFILEGTRAYLEMGIGNARKIIAGPDGNKFLWG